MLITKIYNIIPFSIDTLYNPQSLSRAHAQIIQCKLVGLVDGPEFLLPLRRVRTQEFLYNLSKHQCPDYTEAQKLLQKN